MLTPGAIAFAAYLLAMLVATLRWPAAALAAILVMFPLELWGQVNFPYLVAHPTVTNIGLGLIVALALAIMGTRFRLRRLFGGPVQYCVFFLYLYAFTSVLWTAVPEQAEQLWRHKAPYLVVFLVFVPMLVQDLEDIRTGLISFLVFGSVLAVALVFFVDWGWRGLLAEDTLSYQKGFGNPLALSKLGGYVAIAAVLMKFRTKHFLFVKWALVLVSVLLVAKADSRGQFFAVILCCAAFYPVSRGRVNVKRYLAGGVLSVVLVTAGYAGYLRLAPELVERGVLVERNLDRWTVQALEEAYGGRIDAGLRLLKQWYDGLPDIVFGLGNSASYDKKIIGIYPHIVPLEILGEEGLVGFGIFLAVLAMVFRIVRRLHVHDWERPEYRGVVSTLSAMFVFDLILSFKQGSLIGSVNLFLLAILLERMLLTAQSARAGEKQENTRKNYMLKKLDTP